MTKHINFRTLTAGALALAFAAAFSTSIPAGAKPSYDGLWSVLIVTEKGSCDRAYRYPIRINNGTLVNGNNDSFVITGKVNDTGAVNVTVSHGSKSANGSGKLSGAAGAGTWHGGDCSGTWEAERRAG